jgi:hypothetical protein
MARTTKPASSRARTLLLAAMPAIVGVVRTCVSESRLGDVEGSVLEDTDGGGMMELAVVVRVAVEGGWVVSVRVEVMVVVVSALRTL